jgi:carbonic anhydrase
MTLPAEPARGIAIVTCMDCRLDVLGALGLELGDAHVLRNAGGIVTDDMIRSLAISQRRLGTSEVALIHHTKCGMEGLDEEAFRRELREASDSEPPFALGSFADAEADVRESVRRVQGSPFLPHRDRVRGFIYDVDSGRVREVD